MLTTKIKPRIINYIPIKNYVKEGVFDMKIVVLDGYTENPGDLSWEGLQELGELTVYDRTPVGDTAEIIRRIGDAQAVFTNKTPLTKEVFEACGHIRYVGVLATGYNVVDCESASAKGIPDMQYSYIWNGCGCPVYNCPAFGNLPPYRPSQSGCP